MRLVSLNLLPCLLLFTACRQETETTRLVRETLTESVYASGRIKSKNQYQVFASVNGLLQEVYIQEGDTVRKGTPLFSILNETSRLTRENAQLAAQLADYQANQNRLEDIQLSIDLARSRLLNDSLLYVRQKNLWTQNIGSRVEMEQAELSFKNAKTVWASARLRYADEKRRLELQSRQALKNLAITRTTESDYTVRSILDGRIYDLLAEKGEMVTPQTPLAVIGDAATFVLELDVDEYDITSIREGQVVKVTMDAYKGQVFDATVTKINPIIQPETKSAVVEAIFTTPPPRLYPNLTVEANIILQIKPMALTIPRGYLLDHDRVIMAGGDTVSVEVGLRDYQKAEILSGLTAEDVIRLPVP